MYGKHFAQTYTGSMFGAGPVVFAAWGYVIANTRRDGTVELNAALLAATLGTDVSSVEQALSYLTAPDPRSRSKEHDGRRLIPLGEYLYRVPSYQRFNAMRSDEERRAYNRTKQRESRTRRSRRVKADVKDCQSLSATVSRGQPRSAHIPVTVPVDTTTTDAARPSRSTSDGYPEAFERTFAVYPRRAGGNPKRRAFHAWAARLKSGATADELHAGTERYAHFCHATGKVGTEYVKQSATFFGPDEHFREAWALSSPPDPLEARVTALLTEQAAQEQRDTAWLATRRPPGATS